MPPKSILKNKANNDDDASDLRRNAEQQARNIAVHHAEIIQDRKDVEAELFKSMLELIEMPHAADADPARPATDDIDILNRNLGLFQTTDFEELIQERKANGQCGYVLCPRPHRKESTSANFRIVTKFGDMKIVPREDLEVWCSDLCAKRAMFIEAQLSREPAWLREDNKEFLGITLLTESQVSPQTNKLPLRSKLGSSPNTTADIARGLDELHLERSATKVSMESKSVMQDQITEKHNATGAKEPKVLSEASAEAIEGWIPRTRGS